MGDIRNLKIYCEQCLLSQKTGSATARKEGLKKLAEIVTSHAVQKKITKVKLTFVNKKTFLYCFCVNTYIRRYLYFYNFIYKGMS